MTETFNCIFCNKLIFITPLYYFKCDDCFVSYLVTESKISNDSWQLISIYYSFEDSIYYRLIINLDLNNTIIWIKHPLNSLDHYNFVIPQAFDPPLPSNALKLTKQIHKLKAFL